MKRVVWAVMVDDVCVAICLHEADAEVLAIGYDGVYEKITSDKINQYLGEEP